MCFQAVMMLLLMIFDALMLIVSRTVSVVQASMIARVVGIVKF